MKPEERIQKMRDYELDILVAMFYKETQVGRSISSSNIKEGKKIDTGALKRNLKQPIKKLRGLADEGTLRNIYIHAEIKG